MALTCGIVGLPNVGKSTFFNCLTKARAEAQNYPFCTIDPNVGMVNVPDERLNELSKIVNPERIVPAVVSFVDIAGLVRGASSGEGLGNKFLSHIREANAICHMVRCFVDENITHVEGRIDPINDIGIIETELILKDAETVEKQLDKAKKFAKGQNNLVKKQASFLEGLLNHLNQGKLAKSFIFNKEDEELCSFLNEIHLLTIKPVLFVANVSIEGLKEKNPYVKAVEDLAHERGDEVVVICAKIEDELKDLSDEDKKMFLDDLGIDYSGLEKVIQKAYSLLNLCTYFTAGKKEVRAWTINKGDKAPKAASVIHTDFEKGFIRAEVISFLDFITHKGEAACKSLGKMRVEGKDYVVQDGDIMHFRFNV